MVSRKQLEDYRRAAGGCNDKIGNDGKVTKGRQRGVRTEKKRDQRSPHFSEVQKQPFASCVTGLLQMSWCMYAQCKEHIFHSESIMQRRHD